jgi:hypothetical protein
MKKEGAGVGSVACLWAGRGINSLIRKRDWKLKKED